MELLKLKNTRNGGNSLQGRAEKHIFEDGGTNYWKFDSGFVRIMPEEKI
jgi:hypothetical protein